VKKLDLWTTSWTHLCAELMFCSLFNVFNFICFFIILFLKATMAVPQLRRLFAGFPQRRPGFDPISMHMGRVVDKVAVGQVLRISLPVLITLTAIFIDCHRRCVFPILTASLDKQIKILIPAKIKLFLSFTLEGIRWGRSRDLLLRKSRYQATCVRTLLCVIVICEV
jgi:hypothetical protein